MAKRQPLAVVLERGEKRIFAVARDWPGWSRSGRTEEGALEALLTYAPRYRAALRAAGISTLPPGSDAPTAIVERHRGGSGTDFGVPGVPASRDAAPLTGPEQRRQRAILEAAWHAFDAAARAARGRTLSVGPRGGGRNLAKMTAHVLEAEIAYLGQLGSRHAKPTPGEDEMALVRREALRTLDAVTAGTPLPNPRNTKKPWSPRYFIRRSAWHALDHAWELEDRTPG
ncbi:MAG TPA: hypothetical protein VIA82_04110 [Candidatus Limnocylindria bacterium]|jgi:hypothetical protein